MSLEAALADILERHVGSRGAGGVAVATSDTAQPVTVWLPRSAAREPAYLAYSITKTFVAVLVLLLRDEGRLSLDDRLARWAPDLPHSGRITLLQLLNHTAGFEQVAEHVKQWTPQRTAEVTGIAERLIRQAAEWWGTAPSSFLMHARGIEHHTHGVQNVLGAINIVLASGRIGREGCGYSTITGQGNGQGGREQGQKCDQLPGARDIENPAHRAHIAGVWGVPEETLPRKGLSAVPIVEAIHDGRIKGLLLVCFNPLVSLPDQGFVREALEKLEHFAVIDFFLSETARHADVIFPGSLMEEDEGTTTNVEGRVIHHRRAVAPPPGAREDWRIILDLAARLGAGDKFRYESPRDIFEELRRASKGGVSDYYGITWEKIDEKMGVFWPCPSLDHPGTPRLYEGNRFGHPDGKAHPQPVEWRPAVEEPDADFRLVAMEIDGIELPEEGL